VVKQLLREMLGLPDLEKRVQRIEIRLDEVESKVRNFGDYRNQSSRKLKEMHEEISTLLETVEALVKEREHRVNLLEAKRLRKRLKNNKTRIERELAKRRNNR